MLAGALRGAPFREPAALRIRVQDLVVHLWDLSVATGTPLRIDDPLIAAARRTARELREAGTLPPVTFLIKPDEGLQAAGHGMTCRPCR